MELKIIIFQYILNKITLIIKILKSLKNNNKIPSLYEHKNYFCELASKIIVKTKNIILI